MYSKKVSENIGLIGKNSQFQLNSKQPGQINTVQNRLKRRKTGKLRAVKTVTTDQVSRFISREKKKVRNCSDTGVESSPF